MPFLIEYFLKLNLGLAAVYLLYQLFFRRLTFYTWNRYYLMFYTTLMFFIPFINIQRIIQKNNLADSRVLEIIPSITQTNFQETAATVNSLNRWDYLLLVILAGFIILVIRLIIQHISLYRLRKSATLLVDNAVQLYHVDKNIIPFSYGSSIYINKHQHSQDELREIIRHEFVHVQQKHSIDMLLAECLCLVNWYNPFAWLIRKAIRQNLEFIADNNVLNYGIDKKSYQYLLLKVIGSSQYSIATNFNFTSLKKRIAMMNKMRSAKAHLVKFLFILPLLAVLLLAFRSTFEVNPTKSVINPSIDVGITKPEITADDLSTLTDTIPGRPAPPRVVRPNEKGYTVVATYADGEKVVIVRNKDQKIVKAIDLDEWQEKKKEYEELYGEIVATPPAPPGVAVASSIPKPPKTPTPVKMPEHVRSMSIRDNDAVVKLKDGTVERYDLSKPAEKAAFEKKYGKIPEPPEPPGTPSAIAPSAATINADAAPATAVMAPAKAHASTAISADMVAVQPGNYTLQPGDKEEIILEIKNTTSPEIIEQLQKDVIAKGYKLEWKNLSFNDGILESIEGTIEDENSRTKFVAEDFNKLSITQITFKNGKKAFHVYVHNGTVRL